MSLVYRRGKTCLQSLAPPTLHPVSEPKEQFEPFEPVGDSSEGPACATSTFSCSSVKSTSNNTSCPENPNPSSPSSPTAKSSGLLSSLSSPDKAGNSERDVCLRETPQVCGGFKGGIGGRGNGARPSPAGRLSFIDRKWLERCQVFGEMEAEVKPGAGNQEMVLDKKGEKGRGMEGKMQDDRVGKEELDAEEGGRREATNMERDESISSDKKVSNKVLKLSRQHAGKSRGGEEKANKQGDEETGRGDAASPITGEESEFSNNAKATKKRGRKRQREGDNMEGDIPEEGGVKKRRRNAKNKEESSGVDAGPPQAGGKKRRAKKKGDEDEEEEAKEEKDTKVPKKVSQPVSRSHIVFCCGAGVVNTASFLLRFPRRTC